MLSHPTHPEAFLVELEDLYRDTPERVRPHLEPLHTVVDWAEEYLCKPHPELGRQGPVCPYVEASMHRCLFYLTVIRGADFLQDQVERLIVRYRDWFLDLSPRDGADAGLKSILILFPDVPQEQVPSLIDFTQERLKRLYVDHKLMIGEFHPGPPAKAGLWNDDFRPLKAPLPMLVIRHMVPTDFAFLKDDKGFMEAYLRIFRHQVPAHIRDEVRAAAERFGLYVPRPEDQEAVHPRVTAVLKEHRIKPVVHKHSVMPQPQEGPHDVARALGWSLSRITKSLFLRAQAGGSHAVVVCPVDRRVDLGRLAEMLGTGRLELASAQELAAWLGYSPGGVSAIGADDVPVFLDEALFDYPTVLTAAGEKGVEIEIDPRDLQRITSASVLSLAGERVGVRETVRV